MPSQSLYRKWRSQSFDDVIGQEHIVRTLRNAIRHDRIAHAYLLTGPRGTGKTSIARILAKAVNCLDPRDGAPCTNCALCVSISEGRCPDVIEIDGASNTGIEDIRVLRERLAYAPAEGTTKVYIIDEVHRLSPQAFDGLLKTLEEPPPHVLFAFASTEPHKVPLTILSRCQRFDFHKIDREQTLARLTVVATAEGINVDEGGMLLIAQQAGGSLRDALGILDQAQTFAGDHITADQVRLSIGLGRPDTIAHLTDHMLNADAGKALKLTHDAVASGVDPRSLTRQVIEYWRALLLYTSGAGSDADIDPALQEFAAGHAPRLTPKQVVAVLRALTEEVVEPKLSVSPELPLEIAVVQAIVSLSAAPETSGDTDGRNGSKEPATPEASRTGRQGPPPDGPGHGPSKTATAVHEDTDMTFARTFSETNAAPTSQLGGEAVPSSRSTADSGLVGGTGPDPTKDFAVSGDASDPASLAVTLPDAWPQVIEVARARSRSLQALLRDARLTEMTETELTLAFRHSFHRDALERPENRANIEGAIADVTGTKLKVRCVLAEDTTDVAPLDDTEHFVNEAERVLRGVHARKFRSSKSDS